jgi:hypothetical protein
MIQVYQTKLLPDPSVHSTQQKWFYKLPNLLHFFIACELRKGLQQALLKVSIGLFVKSQPRCLK